MKVNEKLSMMLEKSKTSKDGKAPIIVRLTADGKRLCLRSGTRKRVQPKAAPWNPEYDHRPGKKQTAAAVRNQQLFERCSN